MNALKNAKPTARSVTVEGDVNIVKLYEISRHIIHTPQYPRHSND